MSDDLRERIEVEWFNGNIAEDVRDRLLAATPAPEVADDEREACTKEITDLIADERMTHEARGYDHDHDVEHGPGHLMDWAMVYLRRARRGDWLLEETRERLVKAASLIVAAIEVADALGKPAPRRVPVAEARPDGDALAAVRALVERWGVALDAGRCPSCNHDNATSGQPCDHEEGYHHAWSDLRAALAAADATPESGDLA